MKYYIGEFADIVGLTAHTLKHYERENIISPKFDSSNGYRYYDEKDALDYIVLRMLRNLKLSVPTIADLQEDSTPLQMDKNLELQEHALIKQIEESTNLLHKIRYVRKSFQRINVELDRCVIRQIPEIYRLKKSENHEIINDPETNEATRDLIDALPYSYLSIRVSKEEFFQYSPLDFNWGLGITREDFELLDMQYKPIYDITPGNKVASTIIVKDDVLPIERKDLERLRNYIIENNLEITGEVMIRLLTPAYPDGKVEYYYSIIAPIKDPDNN